jgi:hypothetical protein
MAIFNKINKRHLESTRQWDILADQIKNGNVIPVIGPEILVDDEKGTNPHQILIDDLAEVYEVTSCPKSFSELLYDQNFTDQDRKNIYVMLGDAFEESLFKPSKLIMQLIRTKKFPFVITTSFTPVVEDAMREVWGDELRVMTFCNDPSHNDDIVTRSDISKPTVYYMFGKVCRSDKKYVVTDYDMLNFCRAWLNSAERPQNLTSELQSKYLMMLGNNYKDWLTRFVCFSLRSRLNGQPMGLVVEPQAEEELLQFMKRMDIFTQRNPEEVILKIEEILAEMSKGEEEDDSLGALKNGTDVFISYSRADAKVAARLYDALTASGIRVWYDRYSLNYGSDFMQDIISGIKQTKIFIPIITKNIEAQRNEYHPYRTEWKTAIEMASGFGRSFIIPVSEKGFDFYGSSIPQALKNYNAFLYDVDNPSFDEFVIEVTKLLADI